MYTQCAVYPRGPADFPCKKQAMRLYCKILIVMSPHQTCQYGPSINNTENHYCGFPFATILKGGSIFFFAGMIHYMLSRIRLKIRIASTLRYPDQMFKEDTGIYWKSGLHQHCAILIKCLKKISTDKSFVFYFWDKFKNIWKVSSISEDQSYTFWKDAN